MKKHFKYEVCKTVEELARFINKINSSNDLNLEKVLINADGSGTLVKYYYIVNEYE